MWCFVFIVFFRLPEIMTNKPATTPLALVQSIRSELDCHTLPYGVDKKSNDFLLDYHDLGVAQIS